MELPTKEEIKQLPRWAQVAFAARCARRVLPLYIMTQEDSANRPHLASVNVTITAAEQSAALGQNNPALFSAGADPDKAQSANSIAVTRTADLAVSAARRAHYAPETLLAHVYDSIDIGYSAAHAHHDTYKEAVHRDLELLLALSHAEHWNDETPVTPEVFGPLWPDGPPPGWPTTEENSEGQELTLTLDIPDGMSDDEAARRVTELALSLDKLHRAYGCHGLEISDLEIYGPVPVPAEVAS